MKYTVILLHTYINIKFDIVFTRIGWGMWVQKKSKGSPYDETPYGMWVT